MMMKKILSVLLLALCASVTMAQAKLSGPGVIATDNPADYTEQTEVPHLIVEKDYNSGAAVITIYNNDADPDATLFYSIFSYDYYSEDYYEYDGPLTITEPGQWTVRAYAQAEGKAPSYVVENIFEVEELKPARAMPPIIYPDGRVTSEGLKINFSTDPEYIEYIENAGMGELYDYRYMRPDTIYYRVNGAATWTAYPADEAYLNLRYYSGQYTIEAYGHTEGIMDSPIVTARVVIGSQGYTTLSDGFIVHNGVIYEIAEDGNTVTVAPNLDTLNPGFTLLYSGDITIPESISIGGNSYTVTGIGAYALTTRDRGITELTLPSTVTVIEDELSRLSQLQKITVKDGNPVYDTREGCNALIETATNRLIVGCDKSFIPSTVEVIGRNAFLDRHNLLNIVIPASVTLIEPDAFTGCSQLQYIVCEGQTPPAATGAFDNNWYGYPVFQSVSCVYVPEEALSDYYSHEVWGLFQRIDFFPTYKPIVEFTESADCLTVFVYSTSPLSVNAGHYGGYANPSLTFQIPRLSDNDFHVSIQFMDGSSAFYVGYDSRYSTFTTRPLLYASEVVKGEGLKIDITTDDNNYYENFLWNDGFTYNWPEFCDYSIDGVNWTRLGMGESFILPGYGDYTITARGGADLDKCAYSEITVDVHYGPDGFYSRCNNYIVKDGLMFTINNYGYEVSLDLNYNYIENLSSDSPITLPRLTDIVIPATLNIAGEQYTVTRVYGSGNIPEINSITCLSPTPIDGVYWGDDGAEIFGRATLYVPQEAIEVYKAHEQWGKFARIVPFIGAGPGDVDGDGTLGISDATTLVDLLLSGSLPDWADVDGDGTTSIADVTELIDMLLGN